MRRLLFGDSVEVGFGAKDQGILVDGRRGHEPAVELVDCHHLKFRLGSNNGGFTFFTQKEDAFTVCDGRGGVVASDAFAPRDLTGFGLDATGHAAICNHVNVIAAQQDGWLVGDTALEAPLDVGVG